MMLDQRFQLCTNQQVLTTQDSTDKVNLGDNLLRDYFSGRQLYIDIACTETFGVPNLAADTGSIVISALLSDVGASIVMQAAGSSVFVANGQEIIPTVPAGPYLIAGDHIVLPLNPLTRGMHEYIRQTLPGGSVHALLAAPLAFLSLRFGVTNGGAGFNGGRLSAALTLDPTTQVGTQFYADAVN